MPEAATIGAYLVSQGLSGIVILALSFAVFRLYQRLDKSHAERIADKETDQKRAITALERNTAVLEKIAENMEQINLAFNKKKETRGKEQ